MKRAEARRDVTKAKNEYKEDLRNSGTGIAQWGAGPCLPTLFWGGPCTVLPDLRVLWASPSPTTAAR